MQDKWRTIRAVVEVKVPLNSRIDEKDLVYTVKSQLGPGGMLLPRPMHANAIHVLPKVKSFTRVLAYRRSLGL